MQTIQKPIFRVSLICAVLLFALFIQSAWSKVAIQTQTVSGAIIQILTNHSIHLDNGEFYLPSQSGLVATLHPGQTVTLRYYVNAAGKKIILECAEGVNSLKESSSTPSIEIDNKPL